MYIVMKAWNCECLIYIEVFSNAEDQQVLIIIYRCLGV